MLKVRGLKKNFGTFQLYNIDLDCSTTEPLVILGPCGSGKTLLLECISGLHGKTKGSISLNSIDINSLPPEQRNVGFVYQNYNLFPHLSVQENIIYGTRYTNFSKKKIKARFEELIQTLSLTDLIDRKNVTNLSGGEQQKVTLARALMVQPALLLFDEPLSSLDFNLREKLGNFLSTISKKFEIPSIFVTHSHEEAALLGKNILVLKKGQPVQFDIRTKIYENPANCFVASYLGMKNIFPAKSFPLLTKKMNMPDDLEDSIDKYSLLIPENAIILSCLNKIIPNKSIDNSNSLKMSGTVKEISGNNRELKLKIKFKNFIIHKSIPLEFAGLFPGVTEKTDFIINLKKVRVLKNDNN